MEKQIASTERIADAADVRHVMGQLQDVEIAKILALRPSYRELTEAAIWTRGDGDLATRETHELSPVALAVAEVLATSDESVEQAER